MADNNRNQWVTPAEAARLLGVHRSTVTRAIAAGRIKAHRRKNGQLVLNAETLRAEWASNTHPGLVSNRLTGSQQQETSGPEGLPPYDESRARVEYVRAQLLALELEERRASLVDAEEARAAGVQVRDQLREHLAALAARLAPLIAAESDPAVVHALLSNGARECMREFCSSPV